MVKEQILPITICFFGVCLILVTGRLLQLTRYLFTSSATLLDMTEIICFALPRLVLYALPMATLIGVLLAFVRLNGDSELIAIRAAGIGFCQFLPAILVVLLLTTSLSFYNTLHVMPLANGIFESKLKSLGKTSLPSLMKEGAFIDIIPKVVFFFKAVDPADLSVEGVFVQDQRQPDIRLAIVAERGQINYQRDQNHILFKLTNGIITRIPDDLKDAQAISFKTYDLSLALDEAFGSASKSSKSRKEMTLKELRQMNRKEGKKFDVRYELELHNRLALPMSCLLLGLIGPPLGALFRQRSRMGGITVGIGIFLAYYVGLSAGRGLGENGLISAFFAVWTPNLCAAGIAVYLWVKAQRETPFRLASVLSHWKSLLGRVRPIRLARKGPTS